MTRLVDVMTAMGLHGEVGRSGRWIRFRGEHGAVTVVEAAWGEGYYAFCDGPHADLPREDLTTRSTKLFLDPVSAIESCLRVMGMRPAEWTHHPQDAGTMIRVHPG